MGFIAVDNIRSIKISNNTNLFTNDKVKVIVDKLLVSGKKLKLEIKVQSEHGKLNDLEGAIDVGVVLNKIICTGSTRVYDIDKNTQITVINLIGNEEFNSESIIDFRIDGHRCGIEEVLQLKIDFDKVNV